MGNVGETQDARGLGPREVRRSRVVALLERRWEVPVTAVVAAGGFGKSTALRQAIAANQEGGRGIDVLVTCRPFDAEAHSLADRVLVAVGSRVAVPGEDPVALAGAVVGALAARSPQTVCLILDDVHELGDGTPARELVRTLIRSLPANARAVLCGRSLPEDLGLARLHAAGDLVEITADDLSFDREELSLLAQLHGTAAPDLDAVGGWPALVRLRITTGRRSSLAFLREEVLADLDAGPRRALAAAVLAGRIGDDLLTAIGSTLGAEDLAAVVPLVDVVGTDAVPHSLWAEVLDQIVDGAERRTLALAVGRWWSDADAPDEAIAVLAREGDWDEVGRAALRALRAGNVLVASHQVRRWIDQVPAAEHERSGLLILRGLLARLEEGTPHGDELVARAADELRASGDVEGEAVAVIERFWRAWNECDADALDALRSRAVELEEMVPGVTGVYVGIFEAGAADAVGDAATALAILDARVDMSSAAPAARAYVLMWRATLLVRVGRADAALEAARAAHEEARGAPDTATASQVIVAAWFAGDPGPALHVRDDPGAATARSARDAFVLEVYIAVMAASIGIAMPVDVDALRRSGLDHGRDRAYAAFAGAASAVADGDEGRGRRHVEQLVDELGADHPLVIEELRRFLPYAYVLVPALRDRLDGLEGPTLGPMHRRTLALARAVVAARDGRPLDRAPLPPPAATLTSLPLVWSIELAIAAHGAGREDGLVLAEHLLDVVGEPARRCLRDHQQAGSAAAGALVAAVPAPPDVPVTVRVLGPMEVEWGLSETPVPQLSRRRVRQLLALLVLRRTIGREAAMTHLWPDLDPVRARNNLNVTVGHLRGLLEPGRRKGEASYPVRVRGDHLELHEGGHLSVDLWDADAHLAAAGRHEEAGRTSAALAEYLAVAHLWRGEPLGDLATIDTVAPDRTAVLQSLVDATCRAGELALASRKPALAAGLAEKVLAHDGLIERAHRIAVAAALADGDRGSALRALDRTRDALAGAGLAVSAETQMLARQVTG